MTGRRDGMTSQRGKAEYMRAPSSMPIQGRNANDKRTDPQGYRTKVTALADGFGIRVFRLDKIVSEGHAKTKALIAPVIRELLRWIDKCGSPSEMAAASRHRNYMRVPPVRADGEES